MQTTTQYEKFCLDTAVEFTCARGRGVTRTVQRFSSYDDAVTYAATYGDKRTMVYAINEMGNAAHICNL